MGSPAAGRRQRTRQALPTTSTARVARRRTRSRARSPPRNWPSATKATQISRQLPRLKGRHLLPAHRVRSRRDGWRHRTGQAGRTTGINSPMRRRGIGQPWHRLRAHHPVAHHPVAHHPVAHHLAVRRRDSRQLCLLRVGEVRPRALRRRPPLMAAHLRQHSAPTISRRCLLRLPPTRPTTRRTWRLLRCRLSPLPPCRPATPVRTPRHRLWGHHSLRRHRLWGHHSLRRRRHLGPHTLRHRCLDRHRPALAVGHHCQAHRPALARGHHRPALAVRHHPDRHRPALAALSRCTVGRRQASLVAMDRQWSSRTAPSRALSCRQPTTWPPTRRTARPPSCSAIGRVPLAERTARAQGMVSRRVEGEVPP